MKFMFFPIFFRVVQVSLFLTGTCMWFFWIFTYMTQMNPLIGPILNQRALIAVKNYWGVSTYVFNTIYLLCSVYYLMEWIMLWRRNILPLFTFPDHRQSSWTHSGTLSAVNKKVIWKAMDHRFEGSIFLNNSIIALAFLYILNLEAWLYRVFFAMALPRD